MHGRNFTRVNCSFGAAIWYGDDMSMCKTDNLSLKGMYLKTDHEIPLNVPVRVTVYHSRQSPLNLDAKVVRVEAKKGVGLEINALNANTFAQLRDLVAKNSIDSGKVMQETYKMLGCIQ